MMKQEYIDLVADAFRKGEFVSIKGRGNIKAEYDEAYIDERDDYDFDHVFIHLMKNEREGGFLEVFSVDTEDEYMDSQYAPARSFTEFYTRTMENKLWHIRFMMDPEREFEIEGDFELYTRDFSIIAFYVEKLY